MSQRVPWFRAGGGGEAETGAAMTSLPIQRRHGHGDGLGRRRRLADRRRRGLPGRHLRWRGLALLGFGSRRRSAFAANRRALCHVWSAGTGAAGSWSGGTARIGGGAVCQSGTSISLASGPVRGGSGGAGSGSGIASARTSGTRSPTCPLVCLISVAGSSRRGSVSAGSPLDPEGAGSSRTSKTSRQAELGQWMRWPQLGLEVILRSATRAMDRDEHRSSPRRWLSRLSNSTRNPRAVIPHHDGAACWDRCAGANRGSEHGWAPFPEPCFGPSPQRLTVATFIPARGVALVHNPQCRRRVFPVLVDGPQPLSLVEEDAEHREQARMNGKDHCRRFVPFSPHGRGHPCASDARRTPLLLRSPLWRTPVAHAPGSPQGSWKWMGCPDPTSVRSPSQGRKPGFGRYGRAGLGSKDSGVRVVRHRRLLIASGANAPGSPSREPSRCRPWEYVAARTLDLDDSRLAPYCGATL